MPSPREPDGCPLYRIVDSCSLPTAAAIRCHRPHRPPEHIHGMSTETPGRTARKPAPLAALRVYRDDGWQFDVQHEQASCFSLTSSSVGNRRRPDPRIQSSFPSAHIVLMNPVGQPAGSGSNPMPGFPEGPWASRKRWFAISYAGPLRPSLPRTG
ncbi:hypothetical protein AHiyo1_18930 [Arthrobacter sp. Hiyo1]|nr:hypothetical protein AHiyo1_18930 [Arthrobacter sp. Hiyo1]